VPEEKREELFFLIPKVDTLFVPEELNEFPGRHEPSRSISIRGSPAQPQSLHQSIVMVARERDQAGVALHPTTLGCSVVQAVLGEFAGLGPVEVCPSSDFPIPMWSGTTTRRLFESGPMKARQRYPQAGSPRTKRTGAPAPSST
jgi:hypothetical protein